MYVVRSDKVTILVGSLSTNIPRGTLTAARVKNPGWYCLTTASS